MRVLLLLLITLGSLTATGPEGSAAGKRILLVAANPAVATTTGWPVGFWAAELIHPYQVFSEAGCEITIASPKGGVIVPDAWSDPSDPSGYSAHDTVSADYLARPAFQDKLTKTLPIAMLSPEYFDAVVVVGGQSPMFTFQEATSLQDFFEQAERAQKVVAALCHGTALLLYVEKADGTPFVQGLRMTGFANSEEDAADAAVGQTLMPFRIEDEAKKLGADFQTAAAFEPFAVRSGRIITGQQQASGHQVAQLVLEALAE